MSTRNSTVSPIKPIDEIQALSDEARLVLNNKVESIRERIFDAQAIVDLAGSAPLSEMPAREHSMHRALEVAYKILDKAASDLAADQLLDLEESDHE